MKRTFFDTHTDMDVCVQAYSIRHEDSEVIMHLKNVNDDKTQDVALSEFLSTRFMERVYCFV